MGHLSHSLTSFTLLTHTGRLIWPGGHAALSFSNGSFSEELADSRPPLPVDCLTSTHQFIYLVYLLGLRSHFNTFGLCDEGNVVKKPGVKVIACVITRCC